MFSALTLVTGSLWGRPVWGVWWTWDARLTSTALLLLLELGYLALRRVPGRRARPGPALCRRRDPDRRSTCRSSTSPSTGGTRCTRAGRSSTPGSTSTSTAPCSGRCCSASSRSRSSSSGCSAMRYRIEVLQDAVGDQELEISLSERWSEDAELGRRRGSVRRRVATRGARHELRRRRLRRCASGAASSTGSACSCAAGAGSARWR